MFMIITVFSSSNEIHTKFAKQREIFYLFKQDYFLNAFHYIVHLSILNFKTIDSTSQYRIMQEMNVNA